MKERFTMGKYIVNFACGHTAMIELFGKIKDRDAKVAYFEKYGFCPQCYKEAMIEKRDKERAERRAKAIENATKNNLPELTGSQKQIDWALTIRDEYLNDFLNALHNYTVQVNQIGISEEQKNILLADLEDIKNFFADKTEAKFWINHRDGRLSDMISNTISKECDSAADLRRFVRFCSKYPT